MKKYELSDFEKEIHGEIHDIINRIDSERLDGDRLYVIVQLILSRLSNCLAKQELSITFRTKQRLCREESNKNRRSYKNFMEYNDKIRLLYRYSAIPNLKYTNYPYSKLELLLSRFDNTQKGEVKKWEEIGEHLKEYRTL